MKTLTIRLGALAFVAAGLFNTSVANLVEKFTVSYACSVLPTQTQDDIQLIRNTLTIESIASEKRITAINAAVKDTMKKTGRPVFQVLAITIDDQSLTQPEIQQSLAQLALTNAWTCQRLANIAKS